ncbi:Protein quaking [Sciurus carolinensis]|uniref:Protein quaking n=1 Tax=Sciurus carolinensis TaxID=30640 RepID=A0AA41N1E5_SCICA|nr:Protein quaking [Sciurus carolinensis]
MQLMEMGIPNDNYRDANIKSQALGFSLAATAQAASRIITRPRPVLPTAGPTIMPLIRHIQTTDMLNGTPHPTSAIIPPEPELGLIYTSYQYPYMSTPAASILDYPVEPKVVLGAVATEVQRQHIYVYHYQRIVTKV